jgi:eukaryotic-like serine/threonine-protein kinase
MITADWLATQFADLSAVTRLGEGGQKWVFGAVHDADGAVVLKLVKPSQDLERIRREILAVQQVQSTRVPRVNAAGILQTPAGDCVWLREQRVSGESVRALLRSGALSWERVQRLGLHVLEALADVERAQIVHRDVKPDNIMCDGEGNFWLLDFGIARHLGLSSLTATAALGGPGTPGYAPPEQFRNRKRDVDARADLFALAVTLIECLSGAQPFHHGARDVREVLQRVETVPLPVLPMPGDLDGQFGALVMAMGQRRLDCRPASAAEALEWMREIFAAQAGRS